MKIFRLITQNTIEEKIIERQIVKLKFDKMLMAGQGRGQQEKNANLSKQEI